MYLKASARVSFCLLGLTVGSLLAGGGCDGGSAGTDTAVKPAEEHARRTRQMEEFMKNQGPAKR